MFFNTTTLYISMCFFFTGVTVDMVAERTAAALAERDSETLI